MLPYFQGDELPSWVATISLNGAAVDFSTDWGFTVKLTCAGQPTVSKTAGIAGASNGSVTVTWAAGELNIVPGQWRLQMTGTRVSDSRQFTIEDTVQIKTRSLAE